MRAAFRSPALCRAAHYTRIAVRCSASSGFNMAPAGLNYPKPIVCKALAEHKSTLIMLHGLGEWFRVRDVEAGRAAMCSRVLQGRPSGRCRHPPALPVPAGPYFTSAFGSQ